VSATTTSKELVVVFPATSVALTVTGVVPRVKTDPEAGDQEIVSTPWRRWRWDSRRRPRSPAAVAASPVWVGGRGEHGPVDVDRDRERAREGARGCTLDGLCVDRVRAGGEHVVDLDRHDAEGVGEALAENQGALEQLHELARCGDEREGSAG